MYILGGAIGCCIVVFFCENQFVALFRKKNTYFSVQCFEMDKTGFDQNCQNIVFLSWFKKAHIASRMTFFFNDVISKRNKISRLMDDSFPKKNPHLMSYFPQSPPPTKVHPGDKTLKQRSVVRAHGERSVRHRFARGVFLAYSTRLRWKHHDHTIPLPLN